jgi:hypothetical protein
MYDIEGQYYDIEGWDDEDLYDVEGLDDEDFYDVEGEDDDFYEVEGQDDPDEVFLMGRRRRRRRRGRGRGRRAAPRSRKPARRPSTAFRGQASGVAMTEPTKGRVLSLGFDSVSTIAASAQSTVSSQPQVTFRPDRVIIPDSIAPSFLLNDLKIGKNSMFISATSVPAQAFSHDAAGVGLKMDTAQVSQIISMTVTNISAGALRFYAALTGPSVE